MTLANISSESLTDFYLENELILIKLQSTGLENKEDHYKVNARICLGRGNRIDSAGGLEVDGGTELEKSGRMEEENLRMQEEKMELGSIGGSVEMKYIGNFLESLRMTLVRTPCNGEHKLRTGFYLFFAR